MIFDLLQLVLRQSVRAIFKVDVIILDAVELVSESIHCPKKEKFFLAYF